MAETKRAISAVRCAIYTRQSVTRGTDDELNSLEVQREICAAYVRTQRHRNWLEVPSRYDDGGYSGGSLERPALRRLINDVEQGLVDVIVIYKLDRLTRSLADFIRLIDLLDANAVTFASVTQSFDTRDTLGRLIINILLTFAQFEREMIADRIRDKMQQMRHAGRWTGGAPPYGYDLVDKRLVVNDQEAAIVRALFARYLELGSANQLSEEFRAQGMRAKTHVTRSGSVSGGGLATRGLIYALLGSPVYVGEFHLRGEVFHGQHQPIVDRSVWDAVQVKRNARKLKQPPARPEENLLVGFTFDNVGRKMRIYAGEKNGTAYRYYVSDPNHHASRRGLKHLRAGADDLERLVHTGIASFLRNRFALSAAVHALGQRDGDTDRLIDRGRALASVVEKWDRRRIRHAWEALVARIELSREKVRIVLRCDQIFALLAWSGAGYFRDRSLPNARAYPIHTLEVDAIAVRSERRFRLATDRRVGAGKPRKSLVTVLRMARAVQTAVYENRDQPFDEIARRFRRQPAYVARVLRLNYLAPDIIAAIHDGRHPPELDARKLIYSSIPTDWAQQRALLGFPERSDPAPGDRYY